MSKQNKAKAISSKDKLEISQPTSTEYNKEEFITALKEQVSYHGLNSFFSMSDATSTVFNLTEIAHLFNLESAINKHSTRSSTSCPVFDICKQILNKPINIDWLL